MRISDKFSIRVIHSDIVGRVSVRLVLHSDHCDGSCNRYFTQKIGKWFILNVQVNGVVFRVTWEEATPSFRDYINLSKDDTWSDPLAPLLIDNTMEITFAKPAVGKNSWSGILGQWSLGCKNTSP